MWTEFQRSGIFDEVVQWRTLSTFLETLTFVSACWWFCFPELPRPPVPADEFEQPCNMWTEFQRGGIFDEVVQWRTLSTFLETLTFVSACRWFCFPELPRPPVPADEFEQSCNMWTEFQRNGIFDEVVQWRSLSTFLETLTFVSACWWYCFPELPRPPVPADELSQHARGFASRNYLDLQYPQMNLNNLATCGVSFSAVESSMKLCNGVLCLPSWKL